MHHGLNIIGTDLNREYYVGSRTSLGKASIFMAGGELLVWQ